MSRHLIEELKFNSREALLAAAPMAQGEEPGGLPFRRLIEAVFRARYLVIGTTTFGFLIGAFLAITTPNTFVSEGKFMFTQAGSENIQVDTGRASEIRSESISLNATYVFKAEPLLQRVVTQVTPARILAPYQPGNPEEGGLRALFHGMQRDWNSAKPGEVSEEEALKRLRTGLGVDKPRFSDVLVVSYTANNDRLAQEVLQAYMREAIQWHLEVYDDPKRFEEVQRKAESAVTDHAAAKRALRDFLENNDIQDFDFELKHLRTAEIEAAQLVDKNKIDTDSARLQIGVLEQTLQSIKPTRIVRKRLDNSKEIEQLNSERIKALGERADLWSRVANPESDPRIAELDKKVKILGEELGRANERQMNAPEVPVEEDNPDWREANGQLSRLRLDLVRYTGIQEQLEKNHQRLAAQLKRMLDVEATYLRLQETVRRAEHEMERTATALADAQRKRDLRLGNFSSLQKIEDASLPLEKEGPNRSRLILAGLFAGLFLGLGVVITRALPDTVVRVREDLERALGVPVIGVVPRLDSRNLRRHQSRREQGW